MARAILGQLSRFLDFLSVERGLSSNTLEAYRRDLARYAGYLESKGIPDATRAEEAAVAGDPCRHFFARHRH